MPLEIVFKMTCLLGALQHEKNEHVRGLARHKQVSLYNRTSKKRLMLMICARLHRLG